MTIFKLRFVFMVLIFFFFLLRKKEPVLNMHKFWWGESALDIRSLIHELNIHTTNYNN